MIIASTFLKRLGILSVMAVLAACAARQPAPVTESRPSPTVAPRSAVVDASVKTPLAAPEKNVEAEKTYVIQKGDTLIGVALQNGLDYRELAAWNNIENPNVIKLGERLRLTAPGANVVTASSTSSPSSPSQPQPGEPVATPLIITSVPTAVTPAGTNTDKLKTEPKAGKVPYSDAAYAKLSAEAVSGAIATTAPGAVAVVPTVPIPAPPVAVAPPIAVASAHGDVEWAWPIQPPPKNKIIANFTEANKGIDISGVKSTPVLAAAPGKVVYSGAGLRAYGRLVIIKHNDMWLSAYAHNEKILVAEGQDVKKGQAIAEMGSSDTDQVKLHFEIRKQGMPVDPLKFLPK